MILWESQKLTKVTNLCPHQTRGQMNYLRVEQNSWLRYGLNGFCCVLRYVSVMYIQIEEVVFAFFKNWRFLGRVYKFSFWGIKVLIDFQDFNLKAQDFEFKTFSSKPQKLTKAPTK